ncbi:MAG: hypothetical protein M0D55_10330 [Elusimicrobiota bacterium]|nr:MAG: hypothetical protein M0D55_10330 [Elusimicrobiota bacterium]
MRTRSRRAPLLAACAFALAAAASAFADDVRVAKPTIPPTVPPIAGGAPSSPRASASPPSSRRSRAP